MTYLEEYKREIDAGNIIAGRKLKRELENLVNDLSNPKYIYDTSEFEKRLKFEQSLCTQSKAPYWGVPINLMPWQKAFWEVVYSFKFADTGLRRFNEELLEIARKNGKSTMFSADGCYDLFVGTGGISICCASNDDRQARLIWTEIAGMRQRLDPKNAVTRSNLTRHYNATRNIEVVRLSSKTQNKDGFNFAKVLLDESHDMKDDEIADACWRAMSAVDEPLFLNCTTNGFVTDGYLDTKLSYAYKVIDGEIEDDNFLPWLYEQDSEEEIWQDESSWEKSNPSIRYGVKKVTKLRRDILTAQTDKSARMKMLTKDFNIKQSSAEAWLEYNQIHYEMDDWDIDDFNGAIVIGAVDLSATTDLTNAKACVIKDGQMFVLSHYWIPETKLEDSDDKEHGAKYKEWAKAGYVTICDDEENDLEAVADWFYSLYKNHGWRLLVCGYDQRYAKPFLNRMEEYGFDCEMLQQGFALSSAMKLTEKMLNSRSINTNGNPVDSWCLGNTSIEMRNNGDIRPVKEQELQGKRIDGAVTQIMLTEVYRRHKKEL